MAIIERELNSASRGDPDRFLTLEQLDAGLRALPEQPRDRGRVTLIVRRADGGARELLERVRLTPDDGIPGDAWNRKEGATLESQVTVMQTDVASLIANGQPLALFGDNLFLDLDLSAANIGPGARLRIGEALLEVTPKWHKGCAKFSGRFGRDALRFVLRPEARPLALRGIYVRVLVAGEAGPGDAVEVVSR